MGRDLPLLFALTLLGCDRAPAKESVAAPPVVEPATAAPTKVVVPTEAAPIVEPPAPVEPAPATPGATTTGATDGAAAKPTTTTTTKTTTTTRAAPTERPAPMAPRPPIKAAPPAAATDQALVSDKLFRVELAPLAPCKAAAACEARLVVHALGGYKVNAEYPSKFVAKPAPGVTVEGTGAFVVGSKTVGTMTVTFRATAAGTAKISGALKLSVCTDEVCEIAAPVVAFDVPVS